jgi:hypothetical protein
LDVLNTIFAGQVITGLTVSTTFTENVQFEDILPDVSVALQVTAVVPIGKVEPDGGEQTTELTAQLSATIGAKFTVALHCPAGAVARMFAGQLIEGG